MASAKKTSLPLLVFTKSIKKSYLTKGILPIPDSVYSQHKDGLLNGTVNLRLASDDIWQVEVRDGSIHEGWSTFCEDNNIKENDTLYFRHNGARNFAVEIFNMDGSVKSAAPSTTGKKRGRGKTLADGSEGDEQASLVITSDKAVEIVEQLTSHLDDNHELTFTVTKVPKSTNTELVNPAGNKTPASAKKKTPAKASKDDTNTTSGSPSKSTGKKVAASMEEKTPEPARKRTRTSTGKGTPAATPSKTASATKGKATPASITTRGGKGGGKLTPKRSTRKTRGSVSVSEDVVTETEAAQEKSKKRKNDAGKETPRKSPRKETPRRQSAKKATPVVKKSASKTPKGKKAAQVDEDSAVVKKARAFKSDNPNVMLVMRKSNLQPCFYLFIPSDFAKLHLPSGAVEFDMLDEANKAWGVRWLGPPKSAFSGGWCYFAQDHDLALGDVIVMEVLKTKDSVKIHIFRVNDDSVVAPSSPATKAAITTAVAKVTTVTEEVITATVEVEGVDANATVEGLALDVDKVVDAITEEPTPITAENGDARLEAAKEAPANFSTPEEDIEAGDGDGEDEDDEDYIPNEEDAGDDGGDDGN